MRNWNSDRLLVELAKLPNAAAPRSNFNPGAVGVLLKAGHGTITQSGLLMLTESGRLAAADSAASLSKPVKLRGGAA